MPPRLLDVIGYGDVSPKLSKHIARIIITMTGAKRRLLLMTDFNPLLTIKVQITPEKVE